MRLTPQVEIPPKLIIYVAPADADIFEAIFLFEVTTAEFIEAFAQAFKLPVTPFLTSYYPGAARITRSGNSSNTNVSVQKFTE